VASTVITKLMPVETVGRRKNFDIFT